MAGAYTEIPHNWDDIRDYIKIDAKEIIFSVVTSEKLFFYDTCSFRRHSNLSERGKSFLIDYFRHKNGIIIITRCVLMELASTSGYLNEEYVNYFQVLHCRGIKVFILDEELLFDILAECFSTNLRVNEYLLWSVRMIKSPISTITETLKKEPKLSQEVLSGRNLNSSDLYRRFFSSVRSNKEPSDNLGEELIGICIHILSHLPGIKDGKLCVITDDKGAAAKIDGLMKKTNIQYQGAKIIIFSTSKMVQHMYQELMNLNADDIIEILSQGICGNIVVKGITAYDLEINDEISMTGEEMADKIIEPNGINIVF